LAASLRKNLLKKNYRLKLIRNFDKKKVKMDLQTRNNSEMKPMTMKEFQKRIDQSKEDSQNGRLTESSKLISEIEKWS